MISARKWVYRRSPGGGSMNKKNFMWGGGEFPLWGYFLCVQSFLSTYAGAMPFFRVCGGGGSLFLHGGGGGGALLGLPPHNSFCGSLLSQIFIIFPDRGGLIIFLRELFDPPRKLPPPAPIKKNNLCPPPESVFQLLTLLSLSYNPPPPPRSCQLPEKQSKCAQKWTTLS